MPKRIGHPEPACAERKGANALFLDKEGRWFHEGVEVTHARTCLLLSRSLTRDSTGRYCVRVGNESAKVDLEDAPYTVKSVTIRQGPGKRPDDYILHLNDGTDEPIAPGSLSVSRENVMYGKVKGRSERARFLRPAYYQICVQLRCDDKGERYWLPWRDRQITINVDQGEKQPAKGEEHV